MTHPTLNDLARRLARGETTSRALIEDSLARIADREGEGARAFLTVYAERARAEADAADAARKKGEAAPQFAGIPLSIKDLFDVEGEPTRVGSRVLVAAPPARADADVVALARRAGFVIVGKTNMAEFAYSGLGTNAHYGTPSSPWDRAHRHIPGGSTSGGAVSVADGMTPATIGTDTGGSCRIPAAFCGIVGFKPTQRRVSLKGAFPLAPSLDSIGPMAMSVSCCAALDSVLSGGPGEVEPAAPLRGLAIGVIEGYVDERLDPSVAAAFAGALSRLAKAGVKLTPIRLPELAALPRINRNGSIVDFEAFDGHRDRVGRMGAGYDPWVLGRLETGKGMRAADYAGLLADRARVRAVVDAQSRPFDALAMPTVAIAPPALADLADVAASRAINTLVVRNPAIANFLDRPAVSVPCHPAGGAPAGFMLMGESGHDRRLLAAAKAVEESVRDPS